MKEPWIRVHANIANRPVVARMAEALRIDPYRAVGHLVTFWGAVSGHASNGSIVDVPDALLERWAGWAGKRGAFAAWVRDSHMDEDGRVNEWDSYQGKLEVKREQERQRVREFREKKRYGTPDVTRTEDVQNANGNASVDTHARERDGTGRNGTTTTLPPTSREAVRESLTVPQRLVIAANDAVTAKWGEQTRPLLPGHGPTVQLVTDLQAAGVPVDFAERSIVRQVEGKPDGPPRSMAYFRAGVLDDWAGHQTRELGKGLVPVVPLARPARRAYGETGFLASVVAEAAAKRQAEEMAK